MKVIVPAAGIGSRLRPHTHTLPKALLHVAGKPILGHIFDTIERLHPEEVLVITGFMGEKVQEYLSHHYSLNTRYVEQSELHGLGYAVHLGLQATDDSPTLIILGDTIVETDMNAFVSKGGNVLGLMPVDEPQRFGIAEVENGDVIGLEEKPSNPKSNMALIGLYYINDSAALRNHLQTIVENDLRTRGEIQLTDALQRMIKDGITFSAYPVDRWHDCGRRETLIEANRCLLDKLRPEQRIEGSVIIPPSYVAPSAKVEASIIGPHVSISDRAVIKNSIIRNSIIGYEAEVRNALLTDSLIGHRAAVMGDFRALNVGDSSEIGYY